MNEGKPADPRKELIVFHGSRAQGPVKANRVTDAEGEGFPVWRNGMPGP